MKQLPDEQTLLELLEMARTVEQQARETCELTTAIAIKWERRLAGRQAAKQQARSPEYEDEVEKV